MQGVLVPLAGYLIATRVLAEQLPQLAGCLPLGWFGAFALNFIGVDFLYYWQHRLFHRVPALWAMHQCHHASPTLSIWATSRNTLAVNFLFVYLLVNPLLGFLCDNPDGFFAAAGLTAALDLWRHSRVEAMPGLARVLVTPWQHHWHHSVDGQRTNYGANLMVWDRWFGTACEARGFPLRYGTTGAPSAWATAIWTGCGSMNSETRMPASRSSRTTEPRSGKGTPGVQPTSMTSAPEAW